MTLVIAHRTCPLDAPENSVAGIRAAAEKGADAVEVDLRLSLDQRPYLLHDWTLGRTTGFPLPLELTPSMLVDRLRLEGSREPVPTLGQAYDALDEGLVLAVDIKNPLAARALVREVQARGKEGQTLAWCTSAWSVRYIVKNAPGVEVAYLKNVTSPGAKSVFIARARQLGAAAISAHWRAIESSFVAEAGAAGLRVYSYHQNFALEEEKLRAGLDGLITDRPSEARHALAVL